MDIHSFKKRIADVYNKQFVDRTRPHLDKIYSLFKPKPADWTEEDEGNNSENRYKYFEEGRVNFIVDIISRSFPAIAGEKPLKILDLGCGFGEFSAVFRGFGHDVWSINGGETWYLDDFRYVCEEILDLRYRELSLFDLPDVNLDYVWSSECLTLGSLENKSNKILETLYKIAKQVIVVCHKDRILNYDHAKFSPEIHRHPSNYIDIITYYSNDDYKFLAEKLRDSGKRFGHHINLVPIKNDKHWGIAVRGKPHLINKRFIKFGPPFLYIDADCEIIAPLDELIYLTNANDLCVRERNLQDKYNTGVLGVGPNNNKTLKPFFNDWCNLTDKLFGSTHTVDQKPFEVLLNRPNYKKIKIHKLPPYFNFLPDDILSCNKDKAVILHHKESKTNLLARAWRNKVNKQEGHR